MSIIYIGTYSEVLVPGFGGKGKGIYTLELDNQTGQLSLLHTTKTINSAYLVVSKNREYMYAIKEVFQEKKPVVKAYQINQDYTLEFLNEQSIFGSLPCHIEYHNNAVLVACYGTGNILRFPINTNGQLLKSSHNFKHVGSSINKERQEAPHAHQTVIHPNGKYAFVADLGIDTIKTYQIGIDNIEPNESLDIAIPKGLGPRHIVFNKEGTIGYLINELTGDISILKKEEETFTFLKNVNSLPATYKKKPSSSAIRIHPNGKILYVGNRTLDAITIFTINNDDLELVDYQYTQGKTLREFNISPNGNWLIACLQDSNETIVYSIQSNGKLLEKYRTEAVTSPVCVAFL